VYIPAFFNAVQNKLITFSTDSCAFSYARVLILSDDALLTFKAVGYLRGIQKESGR
jgi:hypothetical protein